MAEHTAPASQITNLYILENLTQYFSRLAVDDSIILKFALKTKSNGDVL